MNVTRLLRMYYITANARELFPFIPGLHSGTAEAGERATAATAAGKPGEGAAGQGAAGTPPGGHSAGHDGAGSRLPGDSARAGHD